MEQLLANGLNLASFCIYCIFVIGAITLPIWGYKLFEKKVLNRHKALEVTRSDAISGKRSMSIVASVGTTTAGVFLIQTLPLVFGIIEDVGGGFGVDMVYGDVMPGVIAEGAINDFYGLTAQLSDMLQTAAPMAAVGLGGYNLINNIGRGLPAITKSMFSSTK